MHRRDVLEVFIATLAAGFTGGRRWELLATPEVDLGLIAAHEQAMAALTTTYIGRDRRGMLATASGFADGLAPLLRLTPTHDLGQRLAAVVVDAHSMAAVLACNAGDLVRTQRHLAQASHVADPSGDPILRARAWCCIAKYLHSPLIDGHGSARQAVALLGRARALGRHADGHTRAWVAACSGEQAAELDERLALAEPCRASLAPGRVADARLACG